MIKTNKIVSSTDNSYVDPKDLVKIADNKLVDMQGNKISLGNVGGFVKPDTNKPLFDKNTPSSISVPAGFRVTINDTVVVLSTLKILDLNQDLDTGSKNPGTDYYVYVNSSETFEISKDKNKGTASNILIGGFHYGLTTENENPTGDKTEADMVNIRGINKYSIWDLKWMPSNGIPEGKFYACNKWNDIYLTDVDYAIRGFSSCVALDGSIAKIAGGATDNGRGVSKIPLTYGGDGAVDFGKYTSFQAALVGNAWGMELHEIHHFQAIAYGVLEEKSSSIDGYETTAGNIEHYPELTSIYGMEQATGTQWLWGSNTAGNRDEGSTDWAWQDNTDGRGQTYALHNNHITTVLLGGDRGDGASAGSRCSSWDYCVWDSYWSIGSRFSCNHLQLV